MAKGRVRVTAVLEFDYETDEPTFDKDTFLEEATDSINTGDFDLDTVNVVGDTLKLDEEDKDEANSTTN